MSHKVSIFIVVLLSWLGLAIAVQAAPTPPRLYEIGANRVIERETGELWMQRGLLNALGRFRVAEESRVLESVSVPPSARDRIIISVDAWNAYARLGPQALIHFLADVEGERFMLGFRDYIPVIADPHATLDDGKLINLSTRGRASATDKLIGGFVIDEQHRRVLVRAVGPGLAAFGVTDAMADPFLIIYSGNLPIYFNGDWKTRPDAEEIMEVSKRVGAFPLEAGSKDAVLLIELAPGNYTARVEPENGDAGTVLLEIYSVP